MPVRLRTRSSRGGARPRAMFCAVDSALRQGDRERALDVGDLAVPKMFGLSLTAGGEVRRVCTLIWRRGELVGVRFISARELRKGVAPEAAAKKAHA